MLAIALGYGDRNWTPADLLAQIAEEVDGYGDIDAKELEGGAPAQEGRLRLERHAVTLLDWVIVVLRVALPALILPAIVIPLAWVERRGAALHPGPARAQPRRALRPVPGRGRHP